MIPSHVLAGIAKKEDKELDLDIYYAIKESIKGSVRELFQVDFGIEGEKGLDFMEDYFTASGWGNIRRVDLNMEKKHALVSVSNSAVASNILAAVYPVDTFLRGFLAGVLSIYFKKDVDCVETKCLAIHATQCNFVIKPLEEFNFENEFTRRQLRVE